MSPAPAAAAALARPLAAVPAAPGTRDHRELQGQLGLASLLLVVSHVYGFDRGGHRGHDHLAHDHRGHDHLGHDHLGRGQALHGGPVDALLPHLDAVAEWFLVLSAFLLALPLARALVARVRQVPLVDPAGDEGCSGLRTLGLYVAAVALLLGSRAVTHLPGAGVRDPRLGAGVVLLLAGSVCGARRLGSRRDRLALLLLVVEGAGALSWTWSYLHGPAVPPPDLPPLAVVLLVKSCVTALGVGAALLVAARPARLGRCGTWSLRASAGALVLLAVAVRTPSPGGGPAYHLLAGLAGTALVLAGALGCERGRWHRVLTGGALPWLGLLGYSLYLWHEPLLLVLSTHGLVPTASPGAFPLTLAVVVGGGLLVAWVGWLLLEWPVARLRAQLATAHCPRTHAPVVLPLPRRELDLARAA